MLIAVSAVAAMPLGKVELLLWQRWIIAAASIAVPPLGYSNTNSDSACCFEKEQDIFSLERDYRTIIQIRIATALVVSKRGGHQHLNKRFKDYYSNTNSVRACIFEKRRTSSVEKDIEGLLFKYK